MKNTFLDKEEDLRHYLELAIAEASDLPARALEQKWMIGNSLTIDDMQKILMQVVRYPRPLTAQNFEAVLERLGIKDAEKEG